MSGANVCFDVCGDPSVRPMQFMPYLAHLERTKKFPNDLKDQLNQRLTYPYARATKTCANCFGEMASTMPCTPNMDPEAFQGDNPIDAYCNYHRKHTDIYNKDVNTFIPDTRCYGAAYCYGHYHDPVRCVSPRFVTEVCDMVSPKNKAYKSAGVL